MRREHRVELDVDGAAWRLDACAEDGRLRLQVVAAGLADGEVRVEVDAEGGLRDLELLTEMLRQAHAALGPPARRRAGGRGGDRARSSQAYAPWMAEEERALLDRFDAGEDVATPAAALGPGAGAVRSRLVRLGRLERGAA